MPSLQLGLEESRLFRFFQEILTQTSNEREMAVQHQTGWRAANPQVELVSEKQSEALKL